MQSPSEVVNALTHPSAGIPAAAKDESPSFATSCDLAGSSFQPPPLLLLRASSPPPPPALPPAPPTLATPASLSSVTPTPAHAHTAYLQNFLRETYLYTCTRTCTRAPTCTRLRTHIHTHENTDTPFVSFPPPPSLSHSPIRNSVSLTASAIARGGTKKKRKTEKR